jgi:hypothetical protein
MGICGEMDADCCDKLVQRSSALVQTANHLTVVQIASSPVQWLAAETSDVL